MKVIDKDEVKFRKLEITKQIKDGALFIHPTDTIYGIACNATLDEAVLKVREIRDRPKRPFSVIAPNKKWIFDNCDVGEEAAEWIERLPGPYTLILKLKNKEAVAPSVNPGIDTIGVRIPTHWIAKAIEELNIPLITTSANKQGNEFMTSLENLDSDIKKAMDFIIYEGPLPGRPSRIVRLTDGVDIEER